MACRRTTFAQAVEETASCKRHLLLGNGFSISAWDGFNYTTLKNKACELEPALVQIFESAGTANFEATMAAVEPQYRPAIKDAFIRTIAAIHPRRGAALAPENRAACAAFLNIFLRSPRSRQRGTIFTTNYDIMLYWILAEHRELNCVDGCDGEGVFRRFDPRVSLIYLHGALHFYEEVGRRYPVRKIQVGTSVESLVEKLRISIEGGRAPLMVSEGTHEEKERKIESSEYLKLAFQKFKGVCASNEVLFVFGHSLSIQDYHLVREIGRSALSAVYVSAKFQSDWDRAAELSDRWASARAARGLPPLMVKAYDADEAPVWTERSA